MTDMAGVPWDLRRFDVLDAWIVDLKALPASADLAKFTQALRIVSGHLADLHARTNWETPRNRPEDEDEDDDFSITGPIGETTPSEVLDVIDPFTFTTVDSAVAVPDDNVVVAPPVAEKKGKSRAVVEDPKPMTNPVVSETVPTKTPAKAAGDAVLKGQGLLRNSTAVCISFATLPYYLLNLSF